MLIPVDQRLIKLGNQDDCDGHHHRSLVLNWKRSGDPMDGRLGNAEYSARLSGETEGLVDGQGENTGDMAV